MQRRWNQPLFSDALWQDHQRWWAQALREGFCFWAPSRWPCLCGGAGPDNLQKSIPTLDTAILGKLWLEFERTWKKLYSSNSSNLLQVTQPMLILMWLQWKKTGKVERKKKSFSLLSVKVNNYRPVVLPSPHFTPYLAILSVVQWNTKQSQYLTSVRWAISELGEKKQYTNPKSKNTATPCIFWCGFFITEKGHALQPHNLYFRLLEEHVCESCIFIPELFWKNALVTQICCCLLKEG